MDRTKASDAFNAGSIPVGCILHHLDFFIGVFIFRKVLSMLKDKLRIALDFVVKHSKIAFPVIICAAVALTVAAALRAGNADKIDNGQASTASAGTETDMAVGTHIEAVPLVENSDEAISNLILLYYNSMANGDMDTLVSLCDEISEKDYFHYQEYAKYIEFYPMVEIYTKPGLEEGSTIAYVYSKTVFVNHEEEFPGYQGYYICTKEDGSLYIKRGENSEEVNDYIRQVSAEDDVIEFNNRITVEYNELLLEKPELFEYLSELDAQVNTAVGVQLAKLEEAEAASQDEQTDAGEENAGTEGGEDQAVEGEPEEPVTQYVTATTTVNVRSSDSEKADRLGKVSGGEKLELVEQRVNGWSKVIFNGKEGYIKSEYLQVAESAAGVETIGTVKATTNVNVRSSASETADKLGIVAGGDTLDLIAEENGWCKVKYNGQIGYVKSDFVE